MNRIARVLVLCAAAGLAACGDDDMTGLGEETLIGSWAVVSVDGQNLPWTQTFTEPGLGTCVFTFASMHLDFRANGTYSGNAATAGGCEGDR